MGLKRRTKISAEFNMSSLTDIIFLLLIFFMLTSNLVSPNALNLKLPGSNSRAEAPPTVSVSVITTGDFYVGKEPVAASDLENRIRTEVQKEDNPEKATIVINAETGTPIEYVVEIMEVARKLKIGAILATEPIK